ncbi:hypothetical protein ACFY9C_07520 [Streptomyces filamentosus]|uniref:hypothetical protein n=1 Tax=Streptomyces filamentosus TaxID=67294 RepID=UPI0036EC19B3
MSVTESSPAADEQPTPAAEGQPNPTPAPTAPAPAAPAPTPTVPAPADAAPVDVPLANVPAADAPADAPPAPRKARRVLAAVARWTAAVVVFAGAGAGTAAWITSLDRHEVPGLATEGDGRWEYPRLSLPALPEGSPRPFTDGNDGEVHHADARRLVLPAPAGAKVDPKADGAWVTTESFLSLYGEEDRAELRTALADSTLRHVAARAWSMPDGTRTTVHLLQFGSVAYAEAFKDEALDAGVAAAPGVLPRGVEAVVPEDYASVVDVPDTTLYAFREKKPYGPEQTRWAYLQTGDIVAVVSQVRAGEALAVPFQQTVTLQNQLLG